ncbi:MAG: M1 family metallopeptidase [Bacteroidota bacterium]
MKNTILLTLILFGAMLTRAQLKTRSYIIDPQLAPREHNVDFQHLRLELSFLPAQGLVKGKATHIFTPLRPRVDSIWLDAIRIRFSSVKVNGKDAKFKVSKDSSGYWIFCPQSLAWETKDSMSIMYECNPRRGLYFIGWNDPDNLSRKQIWSQGQGIDNRNWIPMYDEMNDKMTTEMIVKFEKGYKVLSNGTKLSSKEKDGMITWHYKMKHPHAPYLIMLGIGVYDILQTKSKSGVPMYLYYYPEWKDRVEITYKYSEMMMDWFEKEIGIPYPWESYSQIPVQDFMFGAMENTTATLFGDFFLVDDRSFNDRNYVGVNAHELAHQWFGDYVTARSDAHHWLQESFATYYNQMFEREVFGMDYFNWARRTAQVNSIEESKKNKLPVAHSESGSVRHYPKGAFVLNMLKNVLGGREVYNKCIKHYLQQHPYGNVDTEDLLVACEEVTGMELDWFFEEWVYKGGEPAYSVTYKEVNGLTEITVMQVQELSEVTGLPVQSGVPGNSVSTADFIGLPGESVYRPAGLWKMPIWFEVYYTDGTVDKKLQWIEMQTEVVKIANSSGKKIDYILFDPNNEVMKSVSFAKSWDMLRSQALKAVSMLDRFDAVAAMKDIPVSQKRDVLLQVFEKESFHAVKVEIIAQLAADDDDKTIALFKKACSDKETLVRRAVIEKVKRIPADILPDLEKLLSDQSYETIVLALEMLTTANPSKTKDYLEMTRNIKGTVGRNVEIKWLEVAYESTKDKQYLDKLVEYTSSSYEFRTRVNAAQTLRQLNYFNEQLMKNLLNAMQSANGRLANPCGEALRFFFEQNAHHDTIAAYVYSQPWQSWQLNAIKKYISL